jgi:hypothetical protein
MKKIKWTDEENQNDFNKIDTSKNGKVSGQMDINNKNNMLGENETQHTDI